MDRRERMMLQDQKNGLEHAREEGIVVGEGEKKLLYWSWVKDTVEMRGVDEILYFRLSKSGELDYCSSLSGRSPSLGMKINGDATIYNEYTIASEENAKSSEQMKGEREEFESVIKRKLIEVTQKIERQMQQENPSPLMYSEQAAQDRSEYLEYSINDINPVDDTELAESIRQVLELARSLEGREGDQGLCERLQEVAAQTMRDIERARERSERTKGRDDQDFDR